jgi:hypothetical protein
MLQLTESVPEVVFCSTSMHRCSRGLGICWRLWCCVELSRKVFSEGVARGLSRFHASVVDSFLALIILSALFVGDWEELMPVALPSVGCRCP